MLSGFILLLTMKPQDRPRHATVVMWCCLGSCPISFAAVYVLLYDKADALVELLSSRLGLMVLLILFVALLVGLILRRRAAQERTGSNRGISPEWSTPEGTKWKLCGDVWTHTWWEVGEEEDPNAETAYINPTGSYLVRGYRDLELALSKPETGDDRILLEKRADDDYA